MSDADTARKNGWKVGTRLAGDEGYGETVIEITAIGEAQVLAKTITHAGRPAPYGESLWTFVCRDWREVPRRRCRINDRLVRTLRRIVLRNGVS
ncbi:hypothetical protein SEA_TELAVIV_94 [Mycobacterium phage TelAviv]|uniref:DUF7241 domain-containing protein n=1 Tax=Mycobacterium phage Catdawg TaxID=1340819 RepID=S5XWY9_9CAUD|nr:hypothetical protein PBI_CATDAWG_98 [Mycobacterium phage Catdawg]AGT12069.1 hypothetical protein PBI_CATDAWG_98 [Mycobacterium phage Catdawg]QPO16581.1 hypothetical protein SEA_TELAVIV_94 [Mycobacterium phage TelAviv]